MRPQQTDNTLIMGINIMGGLLAYGLLAISLWLSTDVPLATKGYWGMAVLLLTISIINVVKFRLEAKQGDTGVAAGIHPYIRADAGRGRDKPDRRLSRRGFLLAAAGRHDRKGRCRTGKLRQFHRQSPTFPRPAQGFGCSCPPAPA